MAEYIDREALIQELDAKLCALHGELDENRIVYDAFTDGFEECVGEVEKFQFAADVAPVVHAHWQPYKDTVQCSACGFGTFMDGYFFVRGECAHANDRSFRFSFCPNCGAKMDGGED